MASQEPLDVPETLKSRRVALRLLLEDVASRAGTSAATISRVERGAMRANPDLAEAIAGALSLTREQFDGMWLLEWRRRRAARSDAAQLPTAAPVSGDAGAARRGGR